jgi:hypothetical protein
MNDAQHLIGKLNQLVQDAKTGVQLYRYLYSGVGRIESADDFAQLPILTKPILISERLENILADTARLCITRTFEDNISATDYIPKLLSFEDALDEYKALNHFIMPLSNGGDLKHKIMLLADELHVYAIAELGHQLAYEEHPLAAFIIRNQSLSNLQSHLAWFRPTIIFWDAWQTLPAKMLPDSLKYLFTFNQPDGPETEGSFNQAVRRFDILREAWVGPIAIKADDQPHYTFDPECFYLEDSGDGALLVTSFINQLQPVIRYKLPYRGLMTGANAFVLNGSG